MSCFNSRIGPHKVVYSLEQEKDKIIVHVPYLYVEEKTECENVIVKHNTVEIQNGPKADFIWKFFKEKSACIVLSSIAYNLESALADDFVIPVKPKFEKKQRKKR